MIMYLTHLKVSEIEPVLFTMAPFKCFLILQVVFVAVLLAPSKSQEYVARVIAYPDDGPFRSGQSIPFQCTITPEPPFPVEYLWRSSARNHFDIDDDIPSESPIITVTIEENHPSFARYFCHVLSTVNQTTLAVGSTVLQISGILEPVGSVVKVFTPPSSFTMEVEISEEYSRRRLLRSLNDVTYEWKHNCSRNMLEDVRVRDNILLIPQTTPRHAGDYSVSITSFGLLNSVNKTCSKIVLAALKNYAVFQSVDFDAKNSEVIATLDQTVSRLESSKHHTFPVGYDIQNISFVSGERTEITVSVPLTPLGKFALSRNFDGHSFLLKVFYNGEYIYKGQRKRPSNDVRLPSLLYFNYALMRKEGEISVTLELPTPVPDDEGIYELQMFFSTFEITQRLRTFNCSDYGNLLCSSNGLKLDYVLVGSITLQLQNYAPKVNVSATRLILPTQSSEPLPKLTCSMEESSFAVSQLKWTKGITELAQTQSSQTLDFQISNDRTTSVFGTYTCEVTRGQTKAKNTVHIAERAHFHMNLLPVSGIRCVDITDQVRSAMLEVLLRELELSVSFENDSNITRDIFTNSSLGCSSEGSIAMSANVIFSNNDGSVTASALVARAEEWMNGVRTVNGLSFQLSRPDSQRGTSEMGLDEGQTVAIVLSLTSAIIFFIAIAILATCITVRYKESFKKKLMQEKHNPQNNFPLETESVRDQEANYVLADKTEPAQLMVIPKVSSLQCQRSTLLTAINHKQALNRFQPDGNTAEHSSTSATTNIETSESLNTKATNEPQRMSDISMVLAPNYAYNGMQRLRDENGQTRDKKTSNRRRNLPISTPRQYSAEHSYDYPHLHFAAGRWQGKRKSNVSLNACDSITTVTNASYSMGSK